MATLVEVYVNTDVVGGLADGSSLANAYATQWAAEAGSQRVWTTLDQYGHILCYATAGTADPTSTTWSGHTTDLTHYVTIMPGDSQEHGGKWNTSVYRMSCNDSICVQMQNGFIHFDGIQFEYNYTSVNYSNCYSLTYLGAASVSMILRCLFRTNGGGNISAIAASHANMTAYIADCIIGPTTNRGIYCNVGNLYSYNNTIYNCSSAGIVASATCNLLTVINTAIGLTGDDINSAAISTVIDYCCTDDGDGTNAVAPSGGNWANEYLDPANRDFTLLNTGNCYQGGTDNPGSGLYTTDCIGNPFSSPWDIGAMTYFNPATYFDLAGEISGVGSISGSIDTVFDMTAEISGSGVLSGTMSIIFDLIGEIAGAGVISGNMSIVELLSGVISGIGVISGKLTVTGEFGLYIRFTGDKQGTISFTGDKLGIITQEGDIE